MKKIFALSFTCICFSFYSVAQINWGYKGGLNISRVKNASNNNFTSNISFNTGALAKLKIGVNNFIHAECLFSVKGFNSLLIPSGTNTTNLSYLSLPILFEHRSVNNFYVQLGPEISYLLSARIKNNKTSNSLSGYYKRFDIGAAGGVGYNFSKKIGLETRYIFGLSQINQKPEIFGSECNKTLQFNVIYYFK